MNQTELYQRVREIRKRVKGVLGDTKLTHEFRGSQQYIGYAGTMLETLDMYNDGELTQEAVDILDDYANRVIELHNGGM